MRDLTELTQANDQEVERQRQYLRSEVAQLEALLHIEPSDTSQDTFYMLHRRIQNLEAQITTDPDEDWIQREPIILGEWLAEQQPPSIFRS